jgi:hypothetical protein
LLNAFTVKLVGAAAALRTMSNPMLALPRVSFVDPANARELYQAVVLDPARAVALAGELIASALPRLR